MPGENPHEYSMYFEIFRHSRRHWIGREVALAALLLAGCLADPDSTATPDASGPPAQASASEFVLLPDTQFYACAFPKIIDEQAQWIADNAAALGIGLVIHTGDIVDTPNDPSQWAVVADAVHILDDRVPYLLVPGNHDLDQNRDTLLNNYFSTKEIQARTNLGFFEEGRLENAFATIVLHDEEWLFLGLEFSPRDRVLAWAAEILEEHRTLTAVIFTHAYLYSDGTRYDRLREPAQAYHPDNYQVTAAEGIADGEDIWNALVEPYDNVRLVLSGHVIPDGTARARTVRDSGAVVHEVLTNYQMCEHCPCAEVEGGGGFLRRFVVAGDRTIRVSTFSPYLDRSLEDEENDFELDF